MIAAYRLKGVGWLAASVAVVLGFYLVSLQVAAERKKLEQLDARIAQAHRDIRALETEFDTRANLAQLERWNGDTLALSAPTAGQFVRDEAQLASLDVSAPMQSGGPTLQTAALVVPSAAPAFAPPIATPPAPAPAPVAAVAVAAATPPAITAPRPVHNAAVVKVANADKPSPALAQRASAARAAVAVAKVRPQAVAMLDRKLLSDSTLGSILSGARAEASRRR